MNIPEWAEYMIYAGLLILFIYVILAVRSWPIENHHERLIAEHEYKKAQDMKHKNRVGIVQKIKNLFKCK